MIKILITMNDLNIMSFLVKSLQQLLHFCHRSKMLLCMHLFRIPLLLNDRLQPNLLLSALFLLFVNRLQSIAALLRLVALHPVLEAR